MWLLSAFGLLRLGEGETLLSESDSETAAENRKHKSDEYHPLESHFVLLKPSPLVHLVLWF